MNNEMVPTCLVRKTKVAILFSGQVREIDSELFNQGLELFTQDIDVDIYISCWSEIGKSMNHKVQDVNKIIDKIRVEDFINKAFKNQKVKKINIESYEEWWENQAVQIKQIQNDKEFTYITKNSIAQLYKISDSYKLIDDIDSYDIIMRARFDSIFVTPFKDFRNIKNNVVYTINLERAHYPNRIYDIFFFCSPGKGVSVFNCWERLAEYVYSDFTNGLERRDACRLLYIAADANLVEVKSVDIRYADIYRGEGYLKYLAKIYYWGSKKDNFNLLIPKNKRYFLFKILQKQRLLKAYLKYIYIVRWQLLAFLNRRLV